MILLRNDCFFALIVLALVSGPQLQPILAQESDAVSRNQTEQDEASKVDLEKHLTQFKEAWEESKWQQNFRGNAYMRANEDTGWQVRMKTLQVLVAGGSNSIPVLESHLADDHTPTRILVAQAISYLAPHADIEKLTEHFKSEDDPAVRLYLVDAIGMSGHGTNFDLDALAKDEKNRDVLKHIKYAKERRESPISDAVIKSMTDWDTSTLDSMVVEGQLAPDFKLQSVDGQEYALSDFRGKQPVVLVFVYGDT